MRTITGLFDRYADAQAAISQLESAGVASDDISIVSNDESRRSEYRRPDELSEAEEGVGAGAGIGALAGGAGGLLAGLGLLAIPGIGPVIGAGWLASMLGGAAAGALLGGATGGIVGALMESGVPEDEAHVYAEGVRRGGTLVTARVDEAIAPVAESILANAHSVDPRALRSDYVSQGWQRFDDRLDPAGPSRPGDRPGDRTGFGSRAE